MMNRNYNVSATAYDTPEIVELRKEFVSAQQAMRESQRQWADLLDEKSSRYTSLVTAQRPEYPTAKQIDGLARIAAWVHNDTPYGNTHGHPTDENKAAGRRLPAGVRYSAECRRINIMANAPFMTDSACRMWSLTDEEKASMRDILHSHSLHIVDEWAHDDGIALIVASAKNSGGNL